MKSPPLGPGGEAITWPFQVAPQGRRAHSTRNVKPQTSNLRPRFPSSPAPPLARRVVPRRGGGGAAGWLGVPYVRTRSTRPRPPGGPGVGERWGRQPGSLFSGSEGDSIAVRAPVSRAAGVGLPGGTPHRVPANVVSPRIRGNASPPHVLARGRLGVCVCPGSGAHGLPGGAPWAVGLHPPPPVLAIRGLGLRLPGVGPHSRQVATIPPGCRRHPPWIPPSPEPLLVLGLGLRWWRVPRTVAPVAEGGAQGPGQQGHWPPRP